MSYRLMSKKLLSLLNIEVTNQQEEDIYLYGIELLLATIINCAILAILSAILQIEKEVFFYLIFFTPLRLYGGGIHAKNHIQCIFLFISLLLVSIFAAVCICNIPNYWIIILFITLCKISCALLQHHLTPNKCTKIALYISFIDMVILITFIIINFNFSFNMEYYLIIASMGILIQTLTSIPLLFHRN